MESDKMRVFMILTWDTHDGREHYHVFNENRKRNIREAQDKIKDLWQETALTDDKSKKVKTMDLFEGVIVYWQKKETTVVKDISLEFKKGSPFPLPEVET